MERDLRTPLRGGEEDKGEKADFLSVAAFVRGPTKTGTRGLEGVARVTNSAGGGLPDSVLRWSGLTTEL